MYKAYAAGIAMTKFTRDPTLRIEKMGTEVVREAVQEAGINLKDIQEVYCGNVYNGAELGKR